MRIRTGLTTLAATVATTGVLQLAAPPPAVACSCIPDPGTPARIAAADAVFVGDITARRSSGGLGRGETTWTFDVVAVYKGRVVDRQAVSSSGNGASCGAELPEEGRYVIFAHAEEDGDLTTGLCHGNREVRGGETLADLGTPADPLPGSRGDVARPRWPVLLAVLAVAVAAAATAAAAAVALFGMHRARTAP